MIKFTKPAIRFGRVPDGEIVKIYFRVAKSGSFDWAIYEQL